MEILFFSEKGVAMWLGGCYTFRLTFSQGVVRLFWACDGLQATRLVQFRPPGRGQPELQAPASDLISGQAGHPSL